MILVGLASFLAVALVAAGRTALERWWPYHLGFWDHLLRRPIDQQVTGFSLLGLMALALLLPLRRVLPRIGGSPQAWRVLHGAVGALTVAAIVVHTGLRLGVNLNRILTLTFLELATFGAITAMVPAATVGQSRWMRLLRAVHVAILWPALGLLALHVLAVYAF
jgi:nitrite reductase (NADH) large subunit